MTDYKSVDVLATDGYKITVNFPTSLPTPERMALYDAAFKKVQNRENWKMAIKTIVSGTDDDMNVIAEAIEFYTATVATVRPLGGGSYRVTAPGYYAGPAN